jgi:PAS domain S-box-containing protein
MTESSAEQPQKKPANLPPENLIHVLHVDDEAKFLNSSKSILEMQRSFHVESASSVEEAMKKMEAEKFDAIVSDYIMPEKDGLEFLRELREKGNNIPFIVFTGKGRETVAIKALNLGADQYVNKIGDPETVYSELAHGIRTAVKGKKAEEELVRLASAAKMSPDGIMITDLEVKLLDVNEATLKRYGADDKTDLIGKHSIDFVVPEDREKVLVGVKEAFEKGYCKRLECHLIIKDGSKIHVEMSLTIIKAQDGKPAGFVSVTRDITERKCMEKALQRSEERFRQVAENSGEWIWEVDANGLYTYASPVVEKIVGYKPEELVGKKHFYDLFHPEDQEGLKNAAFQAFAEKSPFREFINRIMHKNGNTVWLSTSGVPIVDNEGSLIGYRGSDKNITEWKNAVEALRESERKHRLLTENITDVIYIQDMNLNVTYASPSVKKLSGYTPKELSKLRPDKFMTPESFERGVADFKDVYYFSYGKSKL